MNKGTKAAIIMATSMNLEIDVKGSYDWINGINGMTIGKEEPTQAQKDFIVQFVKLVGLDGPLRPSTLIGRRHGRPFRALSIVPLRKHVSHSSTALTRAR